jgi:hypothetical protein
VTLVTVTNTYFDSGTNPIERNAQMRTVANSLQRLGVGTQADSARAGIRVDFVVGDMNFAGGSLTVGLPLGGMVVWRGVTSQGIVTIPTRRPNSSGTFL